MNSNNNKINNKMLKLTLLASGLAMAAVTHVSAADRPRMSIGASVGSLGAGAEFSVEVFDVLDARVGLNAAATEYDIEVDGLRYNGDVELSTSTVILDVYPWRSSKFHLSVGAFFNGNEVSGTALPSTAVEFGGRQFQPEEIGSASANISFPSTSPYMGIGWGRRTGIHGALQFSVEAGLFFQGRASVGLEVDNPFGVITSDDIANAREEIESELEAFEVYPVLTIGLSYSF